jgi:hypothetical protein
MLGACVNTRGTRFPSRHHREAGERCKIRGQRSELFHRLALRPLGALGGLKLDLVALRERLKARFFNRRVGDEDIRPIVLRDAPELFFGR